MSTDKGKDSRPRRKSITSTRFDSLAIDKGAINIDDSKALYDRQVRKSSVYEDHKPALLGDSSLKASIGHDISFVYGKDVADSKPNSESTKSFILPNHIDLRAVSISLSKKNNVYAGLGSFFKAYKPSTISCGSSSSSEEEKPIVIFEGEIKGIETPKLDRLEYSFDVSSVNSSVLALQSDIQVAEMCTWPWLDYSVNAQKMFRDSTSCLQFPKDQIQPLPKWKYPLPAHTFKRYLESVEPLISHSQFQKTKNIVEKFALEESKDLHKYLDDLIKSEEDWIPQVLPNYDFCFLSQEAPLLNLGIIAPFCHDVWPEKENSMLERAIVIIRLVTEFWNLVRTETLKTMHDDEGNVINMQQFLELFSTTALPGIPDAMKYRLMRTKSEGETACYISISYKGVLFVMNVVDGDGIPLRLADIGNSLQGIMKFVDSGFSEPQDGIAMLTSADLITWAIERTRLSMLGNNSDCISAMEHAIFALSLDHMNVRTLDQLANEAMFADGCNRWFDKSLNFYVHANGFVTVNVNTKILDGSTVAFLLHYMHLRILAESQMWEDEMKESEMDRSFTELRRYPSYDSTSDSLDKEVVRKKSLLNTELRMLFFCLDMDAVEKIEECAILFKALSSAVQTSVCKLDSFDEKIFSTNQIHKDAFALMAIHLTFFRMYYRPASIGSKVNMKKFGNLRYEILRTTTKQVVKWCKAYLDNDTPLKLKNKLFWKAHNMHIRLLKECTDGKGIENHLNILRNLSDLVGIPSDNNMFNDDGFYLSGGGDRYEILTESLGLNCTSCPVFLPCNPEGYGIGYSVANSFLFFTVTSWEEERASCAPLFAASLKRTCQELLSSIPPVAEKDQ